MNDTAKDTADGAGQWWDPGLLARWIGGIAAAYLVVVAGGVALELLASNTTKELASQHRVVAVVLVAVIGASFRGLVLCRWQWWILATRMPPAAPPMGDRHACAGAGRVAARDRARGRRHLAQGGDTLAAASFRRSSSDP